jgi:hypothetical protein
MPSADRIIHDLVEYAADRSLWLVALVLILGGLLLVVRSYCPPRPGAR